METAAGKKVGYARHVGGFDATSMSDFVTYVETGVADMK